MTVKEIKEKLDGFPDDAIVYIYELGIKEHRVICDISRCSTEKYPSPDIEIGERKGVAGRV